MIITDVSTIDLKNIKRYFAFGCSFVNYRWPTWCDLLNKEMTDCQYFNTGKSGAGNQYISIQLNHFLNTMKPNKDDLITIMWTGFYREDFYLKGTWKTPGNIFTQEELPSQYINNFTDNRGYSIRDFSIVDYAVRSLHALDVPVCMMWGVPPKKQNTYSGVLGDDDGEEPIYDLLAGYKHLDKYMLPDLHGFCTVGDFDTWPNEYVYKTEEGDIFEDYHPSVKTYGKYLNHLGFTLTEDTQTYIDDTDKKCREFERKTQFLEFDRDPEKIF